MELFLILRPDESGKQAIGVFTAPQSLVGFPLATCIVATIARAGRTIGRVEFDSVVVPFAAACLVGGAMFAITSTDPRSRPRSLPDWLSTALTAALNSLLLFVAALGIEKF